MDRIGEYLIRGLVGEGGMGKVYEAEERLSGRKVALKVLRPELARTEEGRRLFLNEMSILARLDHPNLVRCLACSEIEGELVMVLEYLDGITLRQLLGERGALSLNEAVSIVTQTASGLAAAHSQEPPVVHRDLKPENIMIVKDGSVKVMDFGIAKVLQALSKTTTHSAGTLQYMSPEQIDAGPIDGRSDLYALGLVFYELLNGAPPFASPSPRELLNMQCTQAPPPFSDELRLSIPPVVERLILECLAKLPEDRPESARDFLHELEPFAPNPLLPLERLRRGPKRSSSQAGSTEAPRAASAHSEDSSGSEPSAGGRSSDAPASSRKSSHSVPPAREDTIALVEKASAPREVSTRTGLAIIIGLSLLSGIATYWFSANERSVDDRASERSGEGFNELGEAR